MYRLLWQARKRLLMQSTRNIVVVVERGRGEVALGFHVPIERRAAPFHPAAQVNDGFCWLKCKARFQLTVASSQSTERDRVNVAQKVCLGFAVLVLRHLKQKQLATIAPVLISPAEAICTPGFVLLVRRGRRGSRRLLVAARARE